MGSTGTPFKRLIFILIDGAPYHIFEELVENGDLPNIKKYVVAAGCLKKAVSVFPSTTGPAFTPFFMGLFPGTANIPGIRWLSKSEFQNPHRFKRPGVCSYMGLDALSFEADLPSDFPTLFDFFSPVSNIYNPLARGCPPVKNLTRWVKPVAYTYAHFSHRWRFVNQIARRHLCEAVEAGDNFVMCLFPAVDTFSHLSHTQSPQVLETYREIDTTVGQLVATLQRDKTFDETLIVMTSDHGMTNTHTHIDVVQSLDNAGWRCLHYPCLWRRNVRCASMVSGNGMTHLYFKNEAVSLGIDIESQGWGERIPFEHFQQIGIVETLLALEGLALVAGQSEDGGIIIQNRVGKAKIRCHKATELDAKSPLFSYRFEHADPLGYGTNYDMLSSRELLQHTYNTPYPDAIVQLWQIFQSLRTGDLVLSAEKGYDLRARYEIPEHHATHGALLAEHLHIPLAMNVPIDEECIRSVDIFPTLLNLCGHHVTHFPVHRAGSADCEEQFSLLIDRIDGEIVR